MRQRRDWIPPLKIGLRLTQVLLVEMMSCQKRDYPPVQWLCLDNDPIGQINSDTSFCLAYSEKFKSSLRKIDECIYCFEFRVD